ncbi:MAG: CocE/NonD family hydrolase [Ectothiorhodospiraceae bacterium]|nr:CocE/NonD family hydrolase [Ectothiorhodospiraceae bacterium]
MGVLIEKGVAVPMRDGMRLVADVYRPDGVGQYPTIIQRTPYSKEYTPIVNYALDVLRAANAGYAVIVQDTRGRFASEGSFTPFQDEAADGADTVDWAARQPWSNGRVGMAGGSYVGATQWLAATQAPTALRAIAPMVTPDQYYDGWVYRGGAFQLGFNLHWTLSALATGELQRRLAAGEAERAELRRLITAVDNNQALYRRLPLRGLPELGALAPYYDTWLAHPNYDDFWRATAPREHYSRITVPGLNIGGWYDLFLQGTLANYVGMKRYGGSELARSGQRLVIGPWAHGTMSGWHPERGYGLRSGIDGADLTGLQLRWFDHWLRDAQPNVDDSKPVRLFVMGVNNWRDEEDWPLPDTQFTNYFLHSNGHANSLTGDGLLRLEPAADEPPDRFIYDPLNPVPTVGGATFLPGLFVGANSGPRDQREVEIRLDVLSYTTAPLREPLEVIGPVELILYVSSEAVDTDFTGKLVDVHPCGRAEILTDGILRARYRESLTQPSLMQPGRVYALRISLAATAIVFDAGHRIRLDISSSNFPRFDRNPNTGDVIAEATAAEMRPTVNRVHHDRSRPSRLVLPVIRRPDG